MNILLDSFAGNEADEGMGYDGTNYKIPELQEAWSTLRKIILSLPKSKQKELREALHFLLHNAHWEIARMELPPAPKPFYE